MILYENKNYDSLRIARLRHLKVQKVAKIMIL